MWRNFLLHALPAFLPLFWVRGTGLQALCSVSFSESMRPCHPMEVIVFKQLKVWDQVRDQASDTGSQTLARAGRPETSSAVFPTGDTQCFSVFGFRLWLGKRETYCGNKEAWRSYQQPPIEVGRWQNQRWPLRGVETWQSILWKWTGPEKAQGEAEHTRKGKWVDNNMHVTHTRKGFRVTL